MTCFALPSIATAQDGTRSEFWPEVDVWVRVSPATRFLFIASITRFRDTKYTEGTLGTQVDLVLNEHLSVRPGYWYIASLSETDTPYAESRILLDVTLRTGLGAGLQLLDRNRGEMRFIDGDRSGRYRNRLRLERTFARGRELTPYVSGETYYDTRSGDWDRFELTVGCEIEVLRRVSADVYLARQSDPNAAVRHVNAVGVTTNLNY